MLAARVIRRFKVNGAEQERVRLMDFAAMPVNGVMVDLGDGTPPVAVVSTTIHAREIELRPGVVPPAATVRLSPEPGGRLETAEAAGWRRLAEREP